MADNINQEMVERIARVLNSWPSGGEERNRAVATLIIDYLRDSDIRSLALARGMRFAEEPKS